MRGNTVCILYYLRVLSSLHCCHSWFFHIKSVVFSKILRWFGKRYNTVQYFWTSMNVLWKKYVFWRFYVKRLVFWNLTFVTTVNWLRQIKHRYVRPSPGTYVDVETYVENKLPFCYGTRPKPAQLKKKKRSGVWTNSFKVESRNATHWATLPVG